MPTVSAALIVKNEEQYLHNCLKSIRQHVDEIVIVDTGSTDSSIDIAGSFGAQLSHYQWNDDFSAARNIGLEACKTDWILYIDADEQMVLDQPGRLSHYIEEHWIGAYVQFRPKSGYTRYKLPRLFRNDHRLRFVGNIHETILPTLTSISELEKRPIGETRVKLNHFGYENFGIEKHFRNLPLLELATRNNSSRTFCWYHLAETLYALGRKESAIEACYDGLRTSSHDQSMRTRADRSSIFHLLAKIQIECEDDPSETLDLGFKENPRNFGLIYVAAIWHLRRGEFESSLLYASKLLESADAERTSPFVAYDSNIFFRLPLQIKLASLVNLGMFAEAATITQMLATLA